MVGVILATACGCPGFAGRSVTKLEAFAPTMCVVVQVTIAGNSIHVSANLATQAREMQVSGYSYGGNGSTSPITIRSQAAIAITMNALIAELSEAQSTLYLGIGTCTYTLTACSSEVYQPCVQRLAASQDAMQRSDRLPD